MDWTLLLNLYLACGMSLYLTFMVTDWKSILKIVNSNLEKARVRGLAESQTWIFWAMMLLMLVIAGVIYTVGYPVVIALMWHKRNQRNKAN